MEEKKGKGDQEKGNFSMIPHEIVDALITNHDTFIVYLALKRKAAWGDFKKKKRRNFDLKSGEVFTSLADLQKLTKKHRCTVQNALNVLIEMGIISLLKHYSNRGYHLMHTDKCTKSVQDAMTKLKAEDKWAVSKKPSPKTRCLKKCRLDADPEYLVGSDYVESEKYLVGSDYVQVVGSDYVSDEYLVGSDYVTPSPSLIHKRESLIKENLLERSEKSGLSDPHLSLIENDDFLGGGDEQNDLEVAEIYLNTIREIYPRTKQTRESLLKVVVKMKSLMKNSRTPTEDLVPILGYVASEKATPFQKHAFFKNPAKCIQTDIDDTTVFEEVCDCFKNTVRRFRKKYQRRW